MLWFVEFLSSAKPNGAAFFFLLSQLTISAYQWKDYRSIKIKNHSKTHGQALQKWLKKLV